MNTESVSEKFDKLSTGSKAAIAAGSGAAVLGVVAYAIFFCFRQRKKGVEEAALAAKRNEEERMELEGYRAAGINPDGFAEATPTYDPKTGMATRDVLVADGQNEKFGAQPLLSHGGGYSPPVTPDAHPDAFTNPYTDGFSPMDSNNDQHYNGMHPPPSGPLPGVPGQQQQGYFR